MLLKKIIFNTLAIAIVAYFIPGLDYGNNLKTLLVASLVFAFTNAFLKPFLKILLLPINIISLGLLGWLVNVIVLYLTDLIVPGLSIHPFTLTLLGNQLELSVFFSYIVVSFSLNLTLTLISWVFT